MSQVQPDPMEQSGASMRTAPPTVPMAVVKPAQWPTVVGIISVVLGAGGLLMNAASILFTALTPQFMSRMQTITGPSGSGQVQSMASIQEAWMWPTVGVYVLALACSGWLLCAGIMLLRRWPSAGTWHVRYAWVRIVAALAGAVIGFFVQQASMDVAMQGATATGGPNAPGVAMAQSFGKVFAAVGVVFMLLWGWAYPVFLLVCFSRPRVKQELARWATGATA